MKAFFKKLTNTLFLGPLYPNLGKNKFSLKIKVSLFTIYITLTSCEKSEKINEPTLINTSY